MKVALGLGCDRGTATETVRAAIREALALAGATPADVAGVASIELKKDEAGLVAACAAFGWECVWYPAARLREVDVPNPSPTVMKYVGTPSVGEAAAILCAGGTKEDLIVEKRKHRGADGKHATVSVCRWRRD